MKKQPIILLLTVLILLISGCTSKFAYNNIDWMLYWYVDDYVELNKQQKALLDVKIDKWHAWHRSNELVEYRQHLVDLKSQLQQGALTQQQWLDTLERGNKHWQRFRDHISPELTVLAIELTDQQILSFFEELEENNQERIEERNEDTLEERIEENKEDTLKQMKDWIGKLSKLQTEIVNTHVEQFQSTFDEWMIYRRAMQSTAKELMLARNELDDFPQQLSRLMANPDQFRSEAYLRANTHNQAVFASMLTEISASLSEKQQKRAFNKIDDLIDDIDDLIED